MGNSPNLAIRILLSIAGVVLILAAIILLLRGIGWVGQIPDYVLWSLVLLAIGVGILGGIRS